MATDVDTRDPKILEAQPQLYITQIDEALAFYRDRLGFKVVLTHGQPPFYAQVARDGARLHLRLAPGPVFAAEFVAQEVDPVCATLVSDDVAGLHDSCRAAGAHFHRALKREGWGAQTFIVRHPAGNLVLFAGS